mmetsp:Transcript_40754/g.68253  ORF Transcript_40754/g.68253 Transcript_40754/m.68253 type:complete len:410 (-) Transcript_40754:254-1483(-)|eukprot:CAMPEP_0198201282 /NCGR_PEP_ID=MMETSP1445-20131203/4009_1 /TAXON_ID=36898 /ORGANISM="Pyramimonas sp., Strain CCMP2087" /LENGTH=409 /DNA_ID=CAMNT_0043871501 /DNA_START=124 /DNA_END=1353 /DNA_ORIENTATION=+
MSTNSQPPNLRQRAKGKAQDESKKDPVAQVEGKKDTVVPPKKDQLKQALVLVFVFGALFLNLYRVAGTRGWAFVLGFEQSLKLTPEEWQSELQNHTTVMIGGPHRGGTSILWKCLREHSDIASFGETDGSRADESEGMFIQDVYPRWGIGQQTASMLQGAQVPIQSKIDRGIGGLGVYALSPEALIHLTEDNHRVTPENQAKILNSFGYHWNLTKRILLEKTPPNAVMSRFLQALLNVGNSGWDGKSPKATGGESVVRFVFISRDPLANAMAHDALADVVGINFRLLLNNWLAVHEYLMADVDHLQYVKVIRLEDFVKSPAAHLTTIWEWMGLEVPSGLADEVVARNRIVADPNRKYLTKYCRAMKGKGKAGLDKHLKLLEEVNERIKKLDLGYDMISWCTDMSHFEET